MAEVYLFLEGLLQNSIFQYTVSFFYTLGVFFLTVYSIGQLHLVYILLKNRKNYKIEAPKYEDGKWPYVTVQIPMFNEMYVAEHVIEACAKLEYPSDKLEIQVLDDSTDDTLKIAQEAADKWQAKGIDVVVIHRENRQGFKAGALHEGTQVAKGEFIAIFDADFRPNSDFLIRTVGYFQDEKVGVVQGRWGHLNRKYDFLTRAQALLHDAFFMVEQHARSMAGYVLRFNGSAGIWRKETIADAGDWSGETLSEDYDLCLRAQMKGWKIVYDNEVEAPAELPVTMVDFKKQQYRWTKGRGQVIKKHFMNLIKADFSPMVKLHAVFDLLNVFVNVGVLLLAICSVPVIFIVRLNPEIGTFLAYQAFALINVLIAPIFSWIVFQKYHDGFGDRLKEMGTSFVSFLVLIIGFPLFMCVSLVEGFFSSESFFHRTSKYNVLEKKDSWKDKIYTPSEIPILTWFEGLFAIFFAWALYLDISSVSIAFIPFHLLLTVGYTIMFFKSIRKS